MPVRDAEDQAYLSTGFFTLALQTPALFYIVTLFSYCHFKDLLKGTSHDDEDEGYILYWLRHRGLQGVNNFVQSSDQQLSTSDAALASVHMLAWYEFCFGSMEINREHVAGLKTLVELRGGLNGTSIQPQLAQTLHWADLERSRLLHEPLQLSDTLTSVQSMTTASTRRWTGGRIPPLCIKSNLRVLCNLGHSTARCPEIAITVRRLNGLLVGIKERNPDQNTTSGRSSIDLEAAYLDARLTELIPPQTSPSRSPSRASHSNSTPFDLVKIASISLCFGLQRRYGSVSDDQVLREQRKILTLTSQDIERMPDYVRGILLWALLICCSNTSPTQSTLRLVGRLAYGLGLEKWTKVQSFLQTFPWLEELYRDPCHSIWQRSQLGTA